MEEHTGMYGQSRLQKRGAVYYFRAMIPKDLHVLYGRKEIVYSIKTKDAHEARPPALPRRISVLDDATIRGLFDTWQRECLSGDIWSRAHGRVSPRDRHDTGSHTYWVHLCSIG